MADTQLSEVGQLESKEEVVARLKEQRAAHLGQYTDLVEGKTQPTSDVLSRYAEVTIPYSDTLASLPGREDGMEIFLESHPECQPSEIIPPELKEEFKDYLFDRMTGKSFSLHGRAVKRILEGDFSYFYEAEQPFLDEIPLSRLVIAKKDQRLATADSATKGLTLAEALAKGNEYWKKRADNALDITIALTPRFEKPGPPPAETTT